MVGAGVGLSEPTIELRWLLWGEKMRILHYGLQRSGTNLLQYLIEANFNIRILNEANDRTSVLHKHFRVYDAKFKVPSYDYVNNTFIRNFSEFERSLATDTDLIFIISKDPYSWLLSYRRWGMQWGWATPAHHYLEEYNLFYRRWLDFTEETDKIKFVRYYDLLTNPRGWIFELARSDRLPRRFTSRVRPILRHPKKVACSRRFGRRDIEYYLKCEYFKNFTNSEIERCNQILNQEVVHRLGYTLAGHH